MLAKVLQLAVERLLTLSSRSSDGLVDPRGLSLPEPAELGTGDSPVEPPHPWICPLTAVGALIVIVTFFGVSTGANVPLKICGTFNKAV